MKNTSHNALFVVVPCLLAACGRIGPVETPVGDLPLTSTVLSVSAPASDSTLSGSDPLVLNFSTPVNTSGPLPFDIQPTPGQFTLTWAAGNQSVTLMPPAPWAPGTIYTVTVGAGLLAASGQALPKAFSYSFSVREEVPVAPVAGPPNVVSIVAYPDGDGGRLPFMQVTFSEAMNTASVLAALKVNVVTTNACVPDPSGVSCQVLWTSTQDLTSAYRDRLTVDSSGTLYTFGADSSVLDPTVTSVRDLTFSIAVTATDTVGVALTTPGLYDSSTGNFNNIYPAL